MAKTFSLQPVLELMQSRADDATRRLAQLIATERDAQGKLELLQQYREEYARRFLSAGQAGLTPLTWKNFQDFLARLDDAIEQQGRVVANSHNNTVAGQHYWQQQRIKLKAIDTLAIRHQKTEIVQEAKREQKLADEIAARKERERSDNRD